MRPLAALALCFAATPASAEVVSATDHGFELSKRATVKASPAQVYAALGKIGQWWSSAHTYSGNARNMTIRLTAGACFCETVPKAKGTVEHGRVIHAHPGKLLRLQAALGPLQAEGATGILTWTLTPEDGGTEITQSYVIGGYFKNGAKGYAGIVDRVMSEQLERLTKFVEPE